jgi:hypothetical protein
VAFPGTAHRRTSRHCRRESAPPADPGWQDSPSGWIQTKPMAILREHIPYYVDIFNLSGFLADPVITFGYQDCFYGPMPTLWDRVKQDIRLYLRFVSLGKKFTGVRRRFLAEIPPGFDAGNLQEILKNHGMTSVQTMDLFDHRADFFFDMNMKLPIELRGRFSTVIDIGSLEHVFDTKTCLFNLFSLVRRDGHLLIHTPCKGFFDHGFHTFSPECLLQSLTINQFCIKYVKFCTSDGIELEDPGVVSDALIWIVAKKTGDGYDFNVPQQNRWRAFY